MKHDPRLTIILAITLVLAFCGTSRAGDDDGGEGREKREVRETDDERRERDDDDDDNEAADRGRDDRGPGRPTQRRGGGERNKDYAKDLAERDRELRKAAEERDRELDKAAEEAEREGKREKFEEKSDSIWSKYEEEKAKALGKFEEKQGRTVEAEDRRPERGRFDPVPPSERPGPRDGGRGDDDRRGPADETRDQPGDTEKVRELRASLAAVDGRIEREVRRHENRMTELRGKEDRADDKGREKDVRRVAKALRAEQQQHRAAMAELDGRRDELLEKLGRS